MRNRAREGERERMRVQGKIVIKTERDIIARLFAFLMVMNTPSIKAELQVVLVFCTIIIFLP